MKKVLAIALALTLVLSLAACGGKDASPPESNAPSSGSSEHSKPNAPPPSTPSASSTEKPTGGYAPGERTEKLFGHTLCQLVNPVRMVLKMNVEMEEGKTETVDVTISIKDGVAATDFTSPATGHIGSLSKDGKSYTILHDQKMIMEQEQPPIEVPGGIGENDEAYYEELEYTAGTEEIGGKTYEYDEMTEADGSVTRVYFEPGTENWAYMRTGDELVEVVDYGNDPDPTAFTLPSGYTTMDMGAVGGGLPGGFELPEGVELPEDFQLPEGVPLPDGFQMP